MGRTYMEKKLPDINTESTQWYNEIVYEAELADNGPVRGSMIIMPYGYGLWENIVQILDKKIKKTGHKNAAFPLLIPLSFFKKEAEHVEGFAPELAIVTIAGDKELEEPLVVRPTSETIIHHAFSRWIRSWRDLPMKINQWANVVRWEMRTRPFLRSSEFWWQEGHTAHETREEAFEETITMLNEYVDLAESYLAIPVVAGKKPESEKFPGADATYTFEGLMRDGKALQMGTSHMLSQSFAKSFDMKFQDREGNMAYPYLTSWGTTTRLIGALVMTHGDNKGLILPPRVAPIQVVIVPIVKKGHEEEILATAQTLFDQLTHDGCCKNNDGPLRVHIDADQSKTPGAKFYHWEMKGVPLRIEIGKRDLDAGVATVVDRLGIEKIQVPFSELSVFIHEKLDFLQRELFERARQRQQSMWYKIEKIENFGKQLESDGGFYQTGWCGENVCEAKLKEYKATIRCMLDEHAFDVCFACNKKSIGDILAAKAY